MPSFASNVAAQAILVTNTRNGVVMENSDVNRCFILLGPGTATITNYSFSLGTNENAKLDTTFDGPASAIWGTAGAGALKVTEF